MPSRQSIATFALLAASVVVVSAQSAQEKPAPGQPTFSVQVELVTTDVIVHDAAGQFVPDLKKDDFQVFEDNVRQEIASMTLVHGGRVTNVLSVAERQAPVQEGLILPAARPPRDTAGRVFLFFFDDLHIDVHNTAQTRDLFKEIDKKLLHDGDMFAIVSSGPSSLHIDLTYDRQQFQHAIDRITGNGLPPSEIIQTQSGADGPAEIRYRTQVAFATVRDTLINLEKVRNRRKAVVYVSEGYDLIPYQKSRSCDPSQVGGSAFQQNEAACLANMSSQQAGSANGAAPPSSPGTDTGKITEEFADADLSKQMLELTREANRANATFYTIDPRGLVGPLGDVGQNVDPREWRLHVTKAQTTLRVLAEETGGTAVVGTNDFDKGLRRIDAETSDYYVLGFYSSNPDQQKRLRQISVKVDRPGMSVWSRKEYAVRKVAAPPPPPPPPPPQR
jgi:VWFA-related protein